MKLNNIELTFDNFADEMAKLKNEKHFDYLVTIIGEDFGEEGLGCIYILENTESHERCSTKVIAKQVGEDYVIPSVLKLWNAANLLDDIKAGDREVILVAHNGIVRIVESYFREMDNEEFSCCGIKNCEIKRYDF